MEHLISKFQKSIRFHLIILSLFLLLGNQLRGQDFRKMVDENLRLVTSSNDTTRFDAFIKLATFYNFLPNTSDSVNHYAQLAYELSEEYEIAAWKMQANYYKGLFYQRYASNMDSAIHYFTDLENVIKESGRVEKLGATYNALGVSWFSKGNYTKALDYYRQVLSLSEKEKDLVAMANASLSIGSVYLQLGETENAVASMKEALSFNKLDTSADKINVFLNINLNLIDLYNTKDSLEQASKLLDEIEENAIKADYALYRDRYINQKMKFLEKTGKEEELIKLAKKEYLRIQESPNVMPHIYNTVSYYYGRRLVDEKKFKEVKSIVADLKTKSVVEQIDFKVLNYSYIYELSKGIGDYETALEYKEKAQVLNDSLLNEENTKELQEIFARYEVEKKERQLQKLENDRLKLKRNLSILVAVLMSFLALGSVLYLWFYRKRQKERDEIYQVEQKMLALQMNPHFIFNAISSIQNYLFDEGDTKKALQHLSTFSNLMRQILESSREKFIPLEEEVNFLTNYLKLQKLRFDDRFEYQVVIDPRVDVENISIPPLLTQPFIENAIEHGDLHMVEDGKITIKIGIDEDYVYIDIEDNGIGIEASKAKKKSANKNSLAIKIVEERLDLLNKLMKKKFTMNIKDGSSNKGTIINLRVPAIYL